MELDLDEALRYLGAGEHAPEALREEMASLARELTAALSPRYVWRVFDLERRGEDFFLPQPGLSLTGRTAKTMLDRCGQAALLCCTLGAGFETMLRAAQVRDMARAVMLDACGSALVEAGCDAAQQELSARLPGRFFTDRFSPGYGDLPLELQRPICAALDTGRRIGVQVTGSLLLNPGKSVTAVVGLSDRPQMARVRGCAYCTMRETCSLRKGGKTCAI